MEACTSQNCLGSYANLTADSNTDKMVHRRWLCKASVMQELLIHLKCLDCCMKKPPPASGKGSGSLNKKRAHSLGR